MFLLLLRKIFAIIVELCNFLREGPLPQIHFVEERAGGEEVYARGRDSVTDEDIHSSDHKSSQAFKVQSHLSKVVETCGKFEPRVWKQNGLLEKNYVRADPSYLKTLGQAHAGWLFGAIAELVDNARDAKATKLVDLKHILHHTYFFFFFSIS